jgi:hypothetical protein
MATFRVTGGALSGVLVSGNYPDNSLPGDQPGIDNSLPPYIDNTLPPAPPGVFPPPTISNPIVPIPPGTSVPPGTIWPSPGRPDNTLPGQPPRVDNTLPPGVDNTLPGSQPGVDNTLPGGQGGVVTPPIANTTYWMLCYTPNHGWKYVAVDPSLSVGYPLPPYAQPK